MQASFWAASEDPDLKTRGDGTGTANKTVAARVAVVPSNITASPLRVVFDFTPRLDPFATITYQAIIPKNSKVFKIASHGEVKELVELIEDHAASLADHDEDGRSLLHVSYYGRSWRVLSLKVVCNYPFEY